MRRKTDGFTLVELLVVISIIALLLGILLPGLNLARKYTKRVACRASLHDIGLALKMYLDDNRYTLPPRTARRMPYSVTEPTRMTPEEGRVPIVKYLGPYLSVSYAELAQIGTKKVYTKVLSCAGDNYNGASQYFYKQQTSSYEYDPSDRISGQILDKKSFRSGIKASDLAAMSDWFAFHGKQPEADKLDSAVGSYNYLFCDIHVGDRKGY
jgi:prepilin-type N-terminal cleavage/methylation domain-containing protein